MVAVHKVAGEDEEHDEDVKVHRRREEEVVGQEQKGLSTVSALDGSDHSGSLDGSSAVGGSAKGDEVGKNGHPRQGRVVDLSGEAWGCGDGGVVECWA